MSMVGRRVARVMAVVAAMTAAHAEGLDIEAPGVWEKIMEVSNG